MENASRVPLLKNARLKPPIIIMARTQPIRNVAEFFTGWLEKSIDTIAIRGTGLIATPIHNGVM